MVAQNPPAAKTRQEQIFTSRSPITVLSFRERGHEIGFLCSRGQPREARKVRFLNNLYIARIGSEQFRNVIVLGAQLFVNRVAVGDMESLRDTRFGGPFTFTGLLTFGPAETLEEVREDEGV